MGARRRVRATLGTGRALSADIARAGGVSAVKYRR
ncbi:unnamed protein product [Mycetohabitans rhizoxinica HKI 454]|uniref:Uncharacterized protein n=1 Tax=Mycetohabitans rhizoxinica (strain DSM 19002 / CIP 109453 / HKI 454) TaxID=882378 RepID=E5AME9_MYCRK|nr:unnamed protein product [Mycetohabitans rhizoxinica HKI 454]